MQPSNKSPLTKNTISPPKIILPSKANEPALTRSTLQNFDKSNKDKPAPVNGLDSIRTDPNIIDEDIVQSDRKQQSKPRKSKLESSSSPNKTVDISENLQVSQSVSPAKTENKAKAGFQIPADEEYEEEPFEEEYI